MNRIVELASACAAVAVAALLAFNVLSGGTVARPVSASGSFYHPGKIERIVRDPGGCLAAGCHPGAPHKSAPSLAPFRNFHSAFVDCMVCHGRDGMARFSGAQEGSGRRRLSYTGGGAAAGAKGHPALGTAAGCRQCHSEAGSRMLKEHGLSSLPSSYSDPIALRMQEGGAKRWNF